MSTTLTSNTKTLVLMNDESHISFISAFLNGKNCNYEILRINNLKTSMANTLKVLKRKLENTTLQGVIVSSEIDSYRTENLPRFFKKLRVLVGDKPVVLFHPSKVHPEDKKLIKNAIDGPFTALQGHDLRMDSIKDIDSILQTILK